MLFDYDMLMNLSNLDDEKSGLLVDEREGLKRGNIFENEYVPYKNYNPTNIASKDSLLLKLYETNFAIIDLNLYLDLNPNDEKTYDIYKSYVNNYESLKKQYEEKYGPLEITCVNSNTYDWINNPWPWDKNGGNINV